MAQRLTAPVRIERHRGAIDSLRPAGLEFDRMMGSTPFFRPCAYDEQGGDPVLTMNRVVNRAGLNDESRQRVD